MTATPGIPTTDRPLVQRPAPSQEDFERALRSRELGGQATGVLVALGRIDPDTAWQRLLKASQHTNVKVTRLAQAVIAIAAGSGDEADRLDPEAAEVARRTLLPPAKPTRGLSTADRLGLGRARDAIAQERDADAQRRDVVADRADVAGGDEPPGRAQRLSNGGAGQRGAAARDRQASATDRRIAAEDRQAAAGDTEPHQ
jgi:hypothetical protein